MPYDYTKIADGLHPVGTDSYGVVSKIGIWGIICPMKQQIATRFGVAHVYSDFCA